MLISLFLIILLTLSGLAVTYLIDREATLMWRLAVGNIVGTCVYGLIAFIAADLSGALTTTVVIGSLVVTLLTLLVFSRRDVRSQLRHDLQKARGKFYGAN